MNPAYISKPLKRQSWPAIARFLVFGAFNYLAGNLIFTSIWWFWGTKFPYWFIALLATMTASIVSYSTHTFGTLRSHSFDRRNLAFYALVQGIGLIISSLLVPKVAQMLNINLLPVQYDWSAIFSIIGIALLKILANQTKGNEKA
jgi:hypothetical protein